MDDMIQINLEYEDNVYSVHVTISPEILSYETIDCIVHYILYKHSQKAYPEEFLSKEFDGSLSTLSSYQEEPIDDDYYGRIFATGTVIIITYAFKCIVDKDCLSSIIKQTDIAFYNKRFNDMPCSLLVKTKVNMEFVGVDSEELLVLDLDERNVKNIVHKGCNITFTNCNLSRVYVSPYLEVVLSNSEVCLLGNHLLEECRFSCISRDSCSSICRSPNARVFLSLSRYLYYPYDETLWSLKSHGPCSDYLKQQINVYSSITEFTDLIAYPEEQVKICYTDANAEDLSDRLKGISLDNNSTILYINYCTGLGRIYHGRRYLKYCKFRRLASQVDDCSASIDSGNKFIKLFCKVMYSQQLEKSDARLWDIWFTCVGDIENYFPVDLNYKPVIGIFTLGTSVADLCNKLTDVEDF